MMSTKTTSFYHKIDKIAEIATFVTIEDKYFIIIEQYMMPERKKNYNRHWGIRSEVSYDEFCLAFKNWLEVPSAATEEFVALQNKVVNSCDFVDEGIDLFF